MIVTLFSKQNAFRSQPIHLDLFQIKKDSPYLLLPLITDSSSNLNLNICTHSLTFLKSNPYFDNSDRFKSTVITLITYDLLSACEMQQ